MSSSNKANPKQDKQFDTLLSLYSLSSSSNNEEATQTRGDKKFDAAQNVHEIASHVSNAAAELTKFVDTFTNPAELKKNRKAAATIVKKTVVPFLSHASKSLTDAATRLAPLRGSSYVHNRNSKKREREVVDVSSKKRPAIQLMDNFIQRTNPSTPAPVPRRPRLVSPSDSKPSAARSLPLTVVPPPPNNGIQYGRLEFCKIMNGYRKGSRTRKLLFEKIVASNPPLVPHGPASLYRLLSKYESGEPIIGERWPSKGRQKIAEDEEVQELVDRLQHQAGEAFGRKEMNEFLRKTQSEKMIKAGYAPITVPQQFSNTTIDNYMSLAASKDSMCLTESTFNKTEVRHRSENSFNNAASLTIVAAGTHIIPLEHPDPWIQKALNKLPPEKRVLFDWVSDYYGGKPVFPIKPHHIVNSDDKTIFICPGQKPTDTVQYRLATDLSVKERGTHAIYNTDGSSNANGMRVKIHAIVTGNGMSAPPCITVTGLTEYEMPHDDIVVMRIPGLCIGGDVNMQCQDEGFIIFLRGQRGAEKIRFDYIRDNVLLPFIDHIRLVVDGINPGDLIPETDWVAYWMDGDSSGLKSTREGMEDFLRRRITVNKFAASTTGVQQVADLMRTFPVIERLTKLIGDATVESTMKTKIEEAFAQLDASSRLRLRLVKRKALINFTVAVPEIFTKAFTKTNIEAGSTANGFLDSTNHRFPDLQRMLATCKTAPTLSTWNAFKAAFHSLLHQFLNEGIIPDDMFSSFGFPPDVDRNGVIVERPSTIALENQSRAKSLSHRYQINLHQERLREIEYSIQQKQLRAENKARQDYNIDQGTIQKLCAMQGIAAADASPVHLKNSSLEDMSKLLSKFLLLFVVSRHPKFTSPGKLPSKNKGTLDEAKVGVEKLILLAYQVRELPSRLQAPPVAEDVAQDPVEQDEPVAALPVPVAPAANVVALPVPVAPAANVHEVTLSTGHLESDVVLPSEVLSNQANIDLLIAVFNGHSGMLPLLVTDDVKSKADDLLVKHLRGRFRSHIQRRVKNESKQDHWCLKWAMKNLSIVAAYMVLFDHIKVDIGCLSEMSCLLSSPDKLLLCTNAEANLQGCYLYYDTNERLWVRSGKCTGRGFAARHAEHLKKALSPTNTDNSNFYDSYPSRESERAGSSIKDGHFEFLLQYAAAGFDDTAAAVFAKDLGNGGLFRFTDEEKKFIRNTKFSNREGDEKFAEMAAYLFEIGYDIALSPRNNKSGSPGFEACGLML